MNLEYLLASLDRCIHGRHQQDHCDGNGVDPCVAGSRDNPHLSDICGYGVGGRPIFVRDILDAWVESR